MMALVRHQTYLLRYSNTVRNVMTELLAEVEPDLTMRIRDILRDGTKGLTTPREVQQLQRLKAQVESLRGGAWDKANEYLTTEMGALAAAEVSTSAGLIRTLSPVFLEVSLPPMQLVRSIAMARPFEGRTLREWAQAMKADDLRRINAAIQVGMLQGESGPQIANRVAGTGSVSHMTTKQVQAITRTAVMHITNASRTETFRANADIIVGEIFVATLDSRTTPRCRALDRKQFDVGLGPQPPLHIACRSLRVARLNAEEIGNRPFKPFTQKMLVREYAKANNLGSISDRDDLPRGSKGKFDDWARKRARELIGQTPSTTSYQQFLEKQSREFQDDTLGKTKGALFRAGLRLDQFVAREGTELTLAQIAKRHASIFRAAGLDPAAFH